MRQGARRAASAHLHPRTWYTQSACWLCWLGRGSRQSSLTEAHSTVKLCARLNLSISRLPKLSVLLIIALTRKKGVLWTHNLVMNHTEADEFGFDEVHAGQPTMNSTSLIPFQDLDGASTTVSLTSTACNYREKNNRTYAMFGGGGRSPHYRLA